MELSKGELILLLKAVDKKLWSLTHMGVRRTDSRVLAYEDLRKRIQNELASGRYDD